MNPELQQKLVGYLDALEGAAKQAGDFAAAEIPEVVREWLLWLAIERFGHAAGLLIAAVALTFLARFGVRRIGQLQAHDPHDMIPPYMVMTGVSMIAALACTVFCAKSTLEGVKVVVAPRVVLIEEVARIVKDNKP